MASWHADFFVDEWRISPKLNKISKDGKAVGVKLKSMAVLSYLADANGEVVSRDDIMEAVWPGMVVTDDVLTQSIVELRKAFADDAKHPKIIETIPRVGFRLIAAVAPVSMESEPGYVRWNGRRYLPAALALFVVVTVLWYLPGRQEGTRQPVISVDETPSIAVLPLVNTSDDAGNEYFSDGLSDELRNLLTRTPGLKVIGQTSSYAFKGKNEDLRVIGQTLGAKYVLEGSVRKSGDQVRITTQLINVSDGTQMWSDSYDRTMTDIFAVQDDVATAIINALQMHVGTVPFRGRPTESPEAYALSLKARAAISLTEYPEAEKLLLKAVELDPNFAEAYETLAYTYWNFGGGFGDMLEAQRRTSDAAAKAIAIDPDLVLAQALYQGSRFPAYSRLEKIKAFERGVREQPNNTWMLEAFIFVLTEYGYLEEALGLAERYFELDPLSLDAKAHRAATLYAVGRTNEASVALEFADKIDLSPGFWKWTVEGVNLVEGRRETAIAHFETYLQQHNYPDSTWIRELVNGASDPVSGQAYLDRRIPQIAASMEGKDDFNWHVGLTSFYLYFGFLDRHFELIHATEPTSSTWHDAGIHLFRGHIFRRLGFTSHPKYLDLVKLMAVDDIWEQRGPPDFCEKVDGQWVCE